ncbi:MAG: DNA-binding protein HBsu, partial [uncultured Rubrobacteraceae bacterium]
GVKQDGPDRGDRRQGERLEERRPEVLRRVHRGRDGQPQERRAGPDHRLRQVLRAKTRRQAGHQPADKAEDQHTSIQGAQVHRWQRAQGSDQV